MLLAEPFHASLRKKERESNPDGSASLRPRCTSADVGEFQVTAEELAKFSVTKRKRRGILSFWREELPAIDLPWGVFGENLTTEGLLEETLNIGDRLRVGSSEFVVTQPRMPCFKLGIRFNRPDIVKRFLQSGPSSSSRSLRKGKLQLATR